MRLFLTAMLVFLLSCENKQISSIRQSVSHSEISESRSYESRKIAILKLKSNYQNQWQSISRSEKQRIFVAAITDTIIPGWIGTKWDFNGITENPPEGKIACGYFVTTVLRDAGLNNQRIKLAQCASEQMITTLVQDKYIKRFSNIPLEDFLTEITHQGFGIYIVGLDNHTGFIYNDGKEIYFIHSSYVGTGAVVKEPASTSSILFHSKYKVLGNLSADESVLLRWITKK